MIPIVKGWSTEMAQQMASLGVQVHGGMGFIEETGAAQYVRDARITTIYEGTTGIQANDLIGRKIARDGGQALAAAIATMRDVAARAGGGGARRARRDRRAPARGRRRARGRRALGRRAGSATTRAAVLAGAGPFLELAGIVCGGAQLGRAALLAAAKARRRRRRCRLPAREDRDGAPFRRPRASRTRRGLRDTVVAGAAGALAARRRAVLSIRSVLSQSTFHRRRGRATRVSLRPRRLNERQPRRRS